MLQVCVTTEQVLSSQFTAVDLLQDQLENTRVCYSSQFTLSIQKTKYLSACLVANTRCIYTQTQAPFFIIRFRRQKFLWQVVIKVCKYLSSVLILISLELAIMDSWIIGITGASLVAQTVKNPPEIQEIWVWSLRQEDLLWLPTPVFLPGKLHGQRSLEGYSPWGHKELDTTEWLILSLHFIGVKLIFTVVLVSAVQQSESVMHKSTPF